MTDHAGVARRVLSRMAEIDYPDVAQAQVHATLAVADQLRAANLMDFYKGTRWPTDTAEFMFETLGIKEGTE